MKSFVLRFRVKDRKNFKEIKNGLKVIETRAATERYKKIKAGDRLIFICGKTRLIKIIAKVKRFRSVGAMFRAINYAKIMPSAGSASGARKIYYSYPGYKEKIKKFGIIAFWI